MSLAFQLKERWSEFRRRTDASQRFQKTVDVSPSVAMESETRNSKPETFFDAEFLKKLERLRLIAKRLSWPNGKGRHPSPRGGFSHEFSEHRRYQQGDHLRYVDWNMSRRLNRLLR